MPPTTRATASKSATVNIDYESDYGSDIDEDTITDLLVQSESQPLHSITLESIEEHNPLPQVVRLPNHHRINLRARRTKPYIDEDGIAFEVPDNYGPLRQPALEVEYDASNWVAFSPQGDERQRRLFAPFEEETKDDSRSPLQRFRTQPKKPMSVTDLVSPAWCELQYFYSLAKYGRVKQTPAMKQGSSVHKVLEEEVHIAVPVETVTREDMFGLRIWNIIQGLRTLRATGMTRELEVWGVVEGQVVNGIIDELSYKCPDDALESALSEKKKRGRPKKSDAEPDPEQSTLTSFLANTTDARPLDQALASATPVLPRGARKVYITDIKTRSSLSLPSDEVSLRPTFIQLMLYRRLLSQLSLSDVSSTQIFSRYRVDPSVSFSDTFIAQIGGLEHNFPGSITEDDADFAPPLSSAQDSMDELLSHNTLAALWDLMIHEFGLALHAHTLPARVPAAVSPLLQVEYRASGLARRGRAEVQPGQLLGRKLFVHDERRLEGYVRDEMAWWKGERAAKGVEVEEAFKCRICAFAEGCEWRENKAAEEKRKRESKREETLGSSEV